jgi:hypothetical protein
LLSRVPSSGPVNFNWSVAAYGIPVDPSFPSTDDLGMAYQGGGYGDPFLDTIVNDNNIIVSAAINIKAYLDAANISVNRATSCNQIGAGCEGWQAERALEFFEAANSNACDVADAMWELTYQYGQQGFGYDYIDAWNNIAGQFWGMCNNSVR